MIRAPSSDFWHVGIVPAPIAKAADPAALAALRERIVWLPESGRWRYLADPFAVWRDEALHVFVEAFDYRTKHAVIEHHEFSADLCWRDAGTALAQPFHLSYPFLVQDGGETFMIPESHRAGEVALYRATAFPRGWQRETVLLRDVPAAEASVLRHEGRWWMFFTVVGKPARDQRELHLAWAETLTGPWRLHPANPVIDDRSGARPGGTPFVENDRIVLPVQDCGGTYGGAIRLLEFQELGAKKVQWTRRPLRLTGDLVSSSHRDGFHTLAACGDVTLIDVKRVDRSWQRIGVDWRRRLARWRG